MTDKEQIIIDGVDVSECAYFDYENEGTTECDAYGNECDANNCYFKQLARKTQECEELKERLVRTEEDLKYQCVDCMNCQSDRYRKALEEIEGYCNNVLSFTAVRTTESDILDIISRAKGGRK